MANFFNNCRHCTGRALRYSPWEKDVWLLLVVTLGDCFGRQLFGLFNALQSAADSEDQKANQ